LIKGGHKIPQREEAYINKSLFYAQPYGQEGQGKSLADTLYR